jgi:hypothetical protein
LPVGPMFVYGLQHVTSIYAGRCGAAAGLRTTFAGVA